MGLMQHAGSFVFFKTSFKTYFTQTLITTLRLEIMFITVNAESIHSQCQFSKYHALSVGATQSSCRVILGTLTS